MGMVILDLMSSQVIFKDDKVRATDDVRVGIVRGERGGRSRRRRGSVKWGERESRG